MRKSTQNIKYNLHATYIISKVQLLFVFAITLSIMSCSGTKKLDKWISEQYVETIRFSKPKGDYFTFNSPLITADEKISRSNKKRRKFSLSNLFRKDDIIFISTLNPKVPIGLFISAFTTHADSVSLQQKLNGRKLEITIIKMPIAFSFDAYYRNRFFEIGTALLDQVYIVPTTTDIVISYKFLKENIVIKNEVMNILDPNKKMEKTHFKRLKIATIEYLTQYNKNINFIAKSVLEKILEEL